MSFQDQIQEFTVDQFDTFNRQYPMHQSNDMDLVYTMPLYNQTTIKSHYDQQNSEEIFHENEIPLSPIDSKYYFCLTK